MIKLPKNLFIKLMISFLVLFFEQLVSMQLDFQSAPKRPSSELLIEFTHCTGGKKCTHVQYHTDHICFYALKYMRLLDGIYKNLKLLLDSIEALTLDSLSTPGKQFELITKNLLT